jgi:hypothetical protein
MKTYRHYVRVAKDTITQASGSAYISSVYDIDVHGGLKIDLVKITIWDPTTNYYGIIKRVLQISQITRLHI